MRVRRDVPQELHARLLNGKVRPEQKRFLFERRGADAAESREVTAAGFPEGERKPDGFHRGRVPSYETTGECPR